MKRFDEVLAEATSAAITQIFGKPGSDLIHHLNEKQAHLEDQEVSEKVGAFYAYLEKLLGSEQARIVQIAVMKSLVVRLQQEYDEIEGYFSGLDELYRAKFRLLLESESREKSECN